MNDQFVTLVVSMRELQKEYFEAATRLDNVGRGHQLKVLLPKCKAAEQNVDVWIQQYISERVQLDLWIRGEPKKTDEVQAVYTVRDEKAKAGGA